MQAHAPFYMPPAALRGLKNLFEKRFLRISKNFLKKLLLMLLHQRLFHADSSVHMGPLPHMLDADICFASERVAEDVDPYRSLFFFP
jgi:hypothetical protein